MNSPISSFIEALNVFDLKQIWDAESIGDDPYSSSAGRFLTHTVNVQPNRYELIQRKETVGYVNEVKVSSYFPYFLKKGYLGQMRPLLMDIYDSNKLPVFQIYRPFNILLSRTRIKDSEGRILGHVNRHLDPIYRTYSFLDSSKRKLASVKAPLWKPWTFPIKNKRGQEIGRIQKKWPSATEFLTFRQTLKVELKNQMSPEQKLLSLAFALTLDIDLFEGLSR